MSEPNPIPSAWRRATVSHSCAVTSSQPQRPHCPVWRPGHKCLRRRQVVFGRLPRQMRRRPRSFTPGSLSERLSAVLGLDRVVESGLTTVTLGILHCIFSHIARGAGRVAVRQWGISLAGHAFFGTLCGHTEASLTPNHMSVFPLGDCRSSFAQISDFSSSSQVRIENCATKSLSHL